MDGEKTVLGLKFTFTFKTDPSSNLLYHAAETVYTHIVFDSDSDTSVRSVCEPNHIKKHKHIKKRRRRRKTFRHQNFQNVVFWLQKTLKLENKRRRFDVDGGRFLCRHPRCNYLTSWTYKITSILCT